MITSTPKFLFFTPILLVVALISGCNQNDPNKADKVEIKAAPTLTNDATTYAHKAWGLINEIDPVVYTKQIDQIDEQVRKPLRQLSTDWRINVKMTDSVTEGKYALCRKALTSLDTWARETKDNSKTVTQKQADYERDKSQCKDAIDNPVLGNTDPKR
ncbi:hypothetical protein IAE19_05765 [Acinetobacter sp. S40]|uniref:hypothetical protein n=1 Tax=unclassified Acinetobacter TaxID=196816 RepID=UPI00190BDA9A|nr:MULTISPECIES: hypothetical protein [unclassified Acinetobacter]MBJ9984950.1 hypothetical protein [Acinetobacter sp. S40]MBK0063059.1 hypothetical protein [Acinetobacter sp. S55]MBK0066523.1 hypothetical protein [Acinetobacter sp. S54]